MQLAWMSMVAFCLAGFAGAAQAQGNWDVVLNGHAVHVNAAKEWNENNWGLGIEREFDPRSRWVKVALANGFKDSCDEISYMAGGALKRRFRFSDEFYFDVGVSGFLMTRQDVNDNRPFPGALPVLTFGTKHVALNLTYMPDRIVDNVTKANLKDPAMKGVYFFQVKLDARLFSPRTRHAPLFADAGE
ncbi:MAG TPA: hypothetical protein VFX89_16370 [Gammaproteobacteria bacterium]|nr:hypothetical protein [Gammaproteobacteria bacterium]